jgi:pyruvate formate lyase activating enzyme
MALFPLIGAARHRLQTDGFGVTTLVAARGCPLNCRMCLNPHALDPGTPAKELSAGELYDLVRIDDLYFQATGGGVTFGGGEPLLFAEFIREFRELCGGAWRLTAETCLNVPAENVRTAAACVDEFLVDIKDMSPDIYFRYTGRDNARVLENLPLLLNAVGPARVVARVPLIPGYNNREDMQKSAESLKALGVAKFDFFTYKAV